MELKDVLGYLGYDAEKVKTIDDLKGTFEKDFIRASAINEESEFIKPILGKTFGTQENELKKIAKDFGIDLEVDEYKEAKKVSDKVKVLTKLISESKESIIKEQATKLAQGNDEKVKTLETKYEKLMREKAEKEALLEATANEYNQYKQNAASEMKNYKLNHVKTNVFGSVKYNSQASDLAKKGFLATINEKYEFDFDETEKPIIRAKGGQQLKSDKVAGAFLTPEEVITKEAIDAGLYEVNPQAKTQARTVVTVTPTGQTTSHTGTPTRRVATPME
jgi:hypothetical protein